MDGLLGMYIVVAKQESFIHIKCYKRIFKSEVFEWKHFNSFIEIICHTRLTILAGICVSSRNYSFLRTKLLRSVQMKLKGWSIIIQHCWMQFVGHYVE
jgi:hypothetical protein